MIVFHPNIGIFLHVGHLLTYACGWFTACARNEDIIVVPDVNVFNLPGHLKGLSLAELSRVWHGTIDILAEMGLPPTKVFNIRFVAQNWPNVLEASGATCVVRGMDLHPAVASFPVSKLHGAELDHIYSPMILSEANVKLSSTCHGELYSIPWMLESGVSGMQAVKLCWRILQDKYFAPVGVAQMVRAFDPARIRLDPILITELLLVFLQRRQNCIMLPSIARRKEVVRTMLQQEPCT